MIGMGNLPEHAAVIHATVADFVRLHGRKRGLALAAEALHIGPRAARAIYDREWIAASEERLTAALAARRTLRLDRRAALLRELAAIERELDAESLAAGGEPGAMGGGSLAGCGGLVPPPGAPARVIR